MLNILIIDDHTVVRSGIREVLGATFPSAEFHEAGSFKTALAILPQSSFDLVLLDISLPDRNGLDLVKSIRKTHPDVPILIFSMHPEHQFARLAAKAGANGYITKGCSSKEFSAVAQKILNGENHFPSLNAILTLKKPSAKNALDQLSDREREIAGLMAQGRSLKEISTQLDLSPPTVSTYRNRILQKLNLQTSADIIRFALENKLA